MAKKPAVVLKLGPMVRYVDQTSASIWVELDADAALIGKAKPLDKKKKKKGKSVDSAVAHTIQVGGRYYANKENALREPFGLPRELFLDAEYGRMYILDNSVATLEISKDGMFDFNWLVDNEMGGLATALS